MKNYPKFRQMRLRTWQTVFAFIGMFFGINSNVAAQYGVVETTFRINGNIQSALCDTPVKGIRVKIDEIYGDKQINDYSNSVITDEKGDFKFQLYDHYNRDKIKFTITDIDDLNNGLYKDTVFIVPAADGDFKRSGEGHWTILYDYSKPLQVQLQSSGLPPCKEVPLNSDTLQVPAEPAPAMVISPAADQDETGELTALLSEPINDPDQPSLIKIYPNPNHGAFVVEVESSTETKAEMYLFDAVYRQLSKTNIDILQGTNRFPVDMQPYSPGSYFLIIRGKGIDHSEKVIHY
jgi:putative lipoprotein (rSAM/lipoprotein system)